MRFVPARSLRRIAAFKAEREIDARIRSNWLRLPDLKNDRDRTGDNELTAHQGYVNDAWLTYRLRTYKGKVAIIWPEEDTALNPPWDPHAMWRRFTPNYELRVVPGDHFTMLHEHFEHSARALAEFVDQTRSYF